MVHSSAKSRGKRPERDGDRSKDRKSRRKSNGGSSNGARRDRGGHVKEVVWDDDARREYLTGFSKRKREKLERAKERHAVKEREAKLAMRQELREARREQARTNVEFAKQYFGGNEADDVGVTSSAAGRLAHNGTGDEQEYSNEDVTSRVVVEEFNLNSDDDDGDDDDEEEVAVADEDADMEDDDDEDGPNSNMFAAIAPGRIKAATAAARRSSQSQQQQQKQQSFTTPRDSPEKRPAKRFTYETKAARKAEALKQKSRRLEKAEYSKSKRGGQSGRGGLASRKKRS